MRLETISVRVGVPDDVGTLTAPYLLKIAKDKNCTFLWVAWGVEKLPITIGPGSTRMLMLIPAKKDRTPREVQELLQHHGLERPLPEDVLLFVAYHPLLHLNEIIVFPHIPLEGDRVLYLWSWIDPQEQDPKRRKTRRISFSRAKDPIGSQCLIAGILP